MRFGTELFKTNRLKRNNELEAAANVRSLWQNTRNPIRNQTVWILSKLQILNKYWSRFS